MIFYHRFHIQRLYDLGTRRPLRNGRALTTTRFDYNERAWIDPRHWAFLLDYFSEIIDELFDKIVAARPKVIGMSIHQRNEWLSRAMARRLKQALPTPSSWPAATAASAIISAAALFRARLHGDR